MVHTNTNWVKLMLKKTRILIRVIKWIVWMIIESKKKKTSFTCPNSSRRIRSQSMMVFNLCAIVSIVQDLNSSLILFWIKASVCTSTAAVASSRTSIFDRRRSALARLNSCLCPTLKFCPPSKTYKNLNKFNIYNSE